jgi:hypothetical protein
MNYGTPLHNCSPDNWAAFFRQAARARFEHEPNYRRAARIDALHPFYSFTDETRRWIRVALSSKAVGPVSAETEEAVMRVLRDWEKWSKLSEAARSAIRAVLGKCKDGRTNPLS